MCWLVAKVESLVLKSIAELKTGGVAVNTTVPMMQCRGLPDYSVTLTSLPTVSFIIKKDHLTVLKH